MKTPLKISFVKMFIFFCSSWIDGNCLRNDLKIYSQETNTRARDLTQGPNLYPTHVAPKDYSLALRATRAAIMVQELMH